MEKYQQIRLPIRDQHNYCLNMFRCLAAEVKI